MLDIKQSDLLESRKRQLVEPIQQLFQTLEDKKRVEERLLETYDDLLDQVKSALEAKREIGVQLAVQLESLKKASISFFAILFFLSNRSATKAISLFRVYPWKK